MGLDSTLGQMEMFTQVSFTKVRKTVKGLGREVDRKILINTRVSTRKTKNMDMESSNGSQAVNTKATMFKTKRKDLEKCTGLMEVYLRDFGVKVSNLPLEL
jgi:hypothetical protein